MKTIYITAQPHTSWARRYMVQLNNHEEQEPLTPNIARQALNVAVGNDRCVADVDDGRIYYHLTPTSARRL